MLRNVYKEADDEGLVHHRSGAARGLVNTGFAGVGTNVSPPEWLLSGANLDWIGEGKIFRAGREKVAGGGAKAQWRVTR